MHQSHKVTTIFVNHILHLCFLHFHESLLSEETVQAKVACEKFVAWHNTKIKQYHADNGRFANNAFIYHCEDNQQNISNYGMNAHFQNGIAKRVLRDLQDFMQKVDGQRPST